MKRVLSIAGRWLALCVLSGIALQLYFVLRVALMLVIDPQSTTFQRAEVWRIATSQGTLPWRQEWRSYNEISPHLKRAVIASEDASFTEHEGVDWEALEKAYDRNLKARERAERHNERLQKRSQRHPERPVQMRQAKVVGGSTITQQLAKNLFLSGERNLARKAQEFALTFALEALLSKERILEIYLNNVEWGEGVFGAEAAARHYFRVGADQLTPAQAARLAVMLPAPKRFEKRPHSAYVAGRAATVQARMRAVQLP
ncbi:transglycosylase domain-containing protein [Aquabacterium sp. A7-Y]|uniref:transglycosylase domain-containing protein n=1 Tax=Aquabacterium sp. A7-Y TaxID=1349605 RepID=UPI00223D31BF|nr:transglycosylase domain-containing protein [Aquabacterium sp. A7-Y]MCW7537452.1 transglycosylase domain-containing protein [Aquabacterium sp. A7-Y]